MKKIIKKRKRAERLFNIFLVAFSLSLAMLFVSALDISSSYYPGNPNNDSMAMFGAICFMVCAGFGYCTAKALKFYTKISAQVKRYKTGQKNKLNFDI